MIEEAVLAGGSTLYDYDRLGNLVQMTRIDPQNSDVPEYVTRFRYSDAGNLLAT